MLPLPSCLPFGPGLCLALPCGSCVAWGCGGGCSPGLREPPRGPQPPPCPLLSCLGCCCPLFVGFVPRAAVARLSSAWQRALFKSRGAARGRGRAPWVHCHASGERGGPLCLSAGRDSAGTALFPPAYGTRGELFGLGPRAQGGTQRGESTCSGAPSPSSFLSWILEPFLFSLPGVREGEVLGAGGSPCPVPSSVRRYVQLRSAPQLPPRALPPLVFRVCSFILQRRRVFCSSGVRMAPTTRMA